MKRRFTDQQNDTGSNKDTKEELSSLKRYMADISSYPLLSREEERAIGVKALQGNDQAVQSLVNSNLRLVIVVAKEYRNMGLPFLDLISEGNIGLFQAAKRFDPAKGTRFSTYCAIWIRQYIRRALGNQSRTIRLPVYLVDRMARMRRAEVELLHTLGRAPTDQELAQELNEKTDQIQMMRDKQQFTISLDDRYEESVQDLYERLADLNSQEIPDRLARTEEQGLVHEAMQALDDREKHIIINRFGLEGRPVSTLEKIGRRYGLTKERMRQIQAVALDKLRTQMNSDDTLLQAA
jgi:RNA polymerase primary sigma factor